jgi:hypothetical protein
MASVDNINDNIRLLLRALYGIADEDFFRPADQKAATGTIDQQFGTVRIMAMPSVGVDVLTQRDDEALPLNVKETVQGTRHIIASVQFFRGDAYTKAARLPALMRSSLAMDACRARGLGFIRCGSPRNLTQQVDTNFEERGQIDVEFYVIANEVISLPTYGEFPMSIDLAIEKPDGSLYPPQTFEVTAP